MLAFSQVAHQQLEQQAGTLASASPIQQLEQQAGTLASASLKQQLEQQAGTLASASPIQQLEQQAGTLASASLKQQPEQEAGFTGLILQQDDSEISVLEAMLDRPGCYTELSLRGIEENSLHGVSLNGGKSRNTRPEAGFPNCG